MSHKSSVEPPLSNKPPPSNKLPPPSPSIKQVQMAWIRWPVFITMKKDQGYCCAASIWMRCKFIAHFPTHMPFLIYFLGGV